MNQKKKHKNISLMIASFGFFFLGFCYTLFLLDSAMITFNTPGGMLPVAILALFGSLCIIASVGLWMVKPYGCVVGIIYSTMSILSHLRAIYKSEQFFFIELFGITLNLILFSLILLNWKELMNQ